MKKIIIISVITFLLPFLWKGYGGSVFAQQDPQYSQYMFNQMAINPGFAGSREALSAAMFLRTQWTGIDGAPKTESFTVNGPLLEFSRGL